MCWQHCPMPSPTDTIAASVFIGLNVIPLRFALIELVRRLEEQHHVFASDPQRINALLKDETGEFEPKLWLRAERIDSDHALQNLLNQLNSRGALLQQLLLLAWFVVSIFTAVGLMQTPALNFFYVLISVLGLNALMFGLWLVWLLKPQAKAPAWALNVLHWIGGRKPEQQTLLFLYKEQLSRPEMKWFWGKFSHQLWLASLSGLLVGVLLMLLVRQYTFAWQSTLLDQSSLSVLVGMLTWVPQLLGLNVPDAHTVAASQMTGSIEFSRQWANLLWSSLLIYGIVPRLLAWLLCRSRCLSIAPQLPLDKPYYQRLKRMWQTQIVDSAANYRPDAKHSKRPVTEPAAQTLWVSWESAAPRVLWQDAQPLSENIATIDGRTEQEALLKQLDSQPLHLTVLVRLHSLPDRGTMRRLGEFADHAKGGMLVCLWGDVQDDERLSLWQHALDDQAIAWQWKELPNES